MIPPIFEGFNLGRLFRASRPCRWFQNDWRQGIQKLTVSRVEPDGLVLRSKSGISKAYFTELPKEIQERFHYDAAKGNTYSAEQTANQEALYKQQKKAE